jgi:hypothetical protein
MPKDRRDQDEEILWAALQQGVWPCQAGARLHMDPERVVEICEAWASEGIYEYGVAADIGWVAPESTRVDNASSEAGQ